MRNLPTERAPKPPLKYPFQRGFSPQHGVPFEVADGVFWLRMPLPISLDHINLWLLRDGDEWVIVDSGYDAEICKQVWEQVFTNFIQPASVNRIIVTHYHHDHIGLAAWLAHRCDCKIHISDGELERYRKLVEQEPGKVRPEVKEFIVSLGYSPTQQEQYGQFFTVDDKPAQSRVQRADCERLQEGDELLIGGRQWRVVMGNGHSPEHACLHCAELELLISGDQALPRISSNISVYYNNLLDDPLGDWLESCAKLRDLIPSQTIVLPSHQEPFIGLGARMQQLIDDHHAQLNTLRNKIRDKVTATQARKYLFDRELSTVEILLATGETLAHINYLWHRGELEKHEFQGQPTSYQARAA